MRTRTSRLALIRIITRRHASSALRLNAIAQYQHPSTETMVQALRQAIEAADQMDAALLDACGQMIEPARALRLATIQ